MSLQVFVGGKEVAIAEKAEFKLNVPATLGFDIAPGEDESFYVVYDSTGLHSVKVRRVGPRIAPADQKIIDDFLIDSFARGFAKGG